MIKCKFCDHKGQSIVEESTSLLTYLFLALYMLFTWQWSDGFMYWFIIAVFILPILAGLFRIKSHSCKNCLNEVKQESLFNNLDFDDDIAEI